MSHQHRARSSGCMSKQAQRHPVRGQYVFFDPKMEQIQCLTSRETLRPTYQCYNWEICAGAICQLKWSDHSKATDLVRRFQQIVEIRGVEA